MANWWSIEDFIRIYCEVNQTFVMEYNYADKHKTNVLECQSPVERNGSSKSPGIWGYGFLNVNRGNGFMHIFIERHNANAVKMLITQIFISIYSRN